MKTLASAYNFLIMALAVMAGAMIGFAFVLIIVDVGMRAVGLQPPAFTSAAVEYILLYFTLFAAPYLTRKKAHVCVDALITHLHGRLRWWLEKFVYIVCIATCLIFAYVGFGLTLDAIRSGGFEERSIDVPLWINYVPMAPAFLLIAIEFGRYLGGIDTLYIDRTEVQDSV